MSDTSDHAHVMIRPPLAWLLAIIAGLAMDRALALPFIPPAIPHIALGAAVFVLGVALGFWAVATMRRAGTDISTSTATQAIVASGPYRVTRNPIYLGMFIGQIGLAIGFNSLWLLATLVPFALVLRYGVIAREEAYLERTFGAVYLGYRSRVRRFL